MIATYLRLCLHGPVSVLRGVDRVYWPLSNYVLEHLYRNVEHACILVSVDYSCLARVTLLHYIELFKLKHLQKSFFGIGRNRTNPEHPATLLMVFIGNAYYALKGHSREHCTA